MSWQDRLQEAAYNSPSGARLIFGYEDVSKSIDKKTTAFNFPDADGTYVQDLGHSGRQYPLRLFFTGDNCDLEANYFEGLLLERGVGRLEHPAYGTIDVVPFGTISRRDDLKTAANQAVLEVTFFETIGLVYPSSQGDPSSAVIEAVDEYNDAAAGEFSGSVDLTKVSLVAGVKGKFTSILNTVKTGLSGVANTQDNVRKQFNNTVNSIENGLDILVAQPLTLAYQALIMIQSPSRAVALIKDRLAAYRNLANSIIGKSPANKNDFVVSDLYASTSVTGSILSVINNQFDTRDDALAAADELISQLDAVTLWRDTSYKSLGEIDTGASYQKLQAAVALAAGYLVQISFDLKQQRAIVLERERTIIDLAAELYGSVDDILDFLINSNNLTGSEIIELPRGRRIVYYV